MLRNYIKRQCSFVNIIVLFSMALLLLFYYHSKYYFNITFITSEFTMEFKVLLFLIVLLLLYNSFSDNKNKDNIFIWLFWFLIILSSGILYSAYVEAFLAMENVKDYLLEHKYLKISIQYTMAYKCYFVKEYLNLIYTPMLEKYLDISPEFFNIELFQEMCKYLDFNTLLNEDDTIENIKNKSKIFLLLFIDYRLEHANFIACMHKDSLWKESFLYNSLLFLRNTVIILTTPLILSHIPVIILKLSHLPMIWVYRNFPSLVLQKAINIMTYHFDNYPLVFEGSQQEKEDFILLLAYILIRHKDISWIYAQPWYLC